MSLLSFSSVYNILTSFFLHFGGSICQLQLESLNVFQKFRVDYLAGLSCHLLILKYAHHHWCCLRLCWHFLYYLHRYHPQYSCCFFVTTSCTLYAISINPFALLPLIGHQHPIPRFHFFLCQERNFDVVVGQMQAHKVISSWYHAQ